ncbi:MAG: MBL fold metallo-hydrolase, partial [Rhizobiaceae bacterium]|nr:MBL fold metallo-hydrolase [Rhizobiaceae bacterium]
LKNNIWKKEATILFVGYQAPGTTGHLITSGEKEIRIHGQNFKVKATIRRLGNYSAHADQQELLDWIIERGPVVGGLFLNHGDGDARAELRRLVAEKGWDIDKIYMPHFDESFELKAGSAKSKGRTPQRMDETALQRDWHNDYAAFLIQLDGQLEDETNLEKRRELIAKLKSVMPKA